MLDFNRLRSGPDGWRGAFEDLVRQLGRLQPPPNAIEFRHIHGAGGDGGIEAYWRLSGGNEHGYQAKFHTKPGDIDWGALDRSIETALSTHPNLVTIQVAIACDLTDAVAGRRGRTAWQQWETHRDRWCELARSAGRVVNFLFWGASEIEEMLAKSEAAGLRQYWFGEGVFTSDWLKKHFDSTMAALDERFHPEDHVDVDTRSAFDGLRRNALWRESLALHLSEILDQHVRGPEGDPTVEAKFTALATAVETFRGLDADIQLPAELPFPTQTWIDVVSNVRDAAHAASQSLRSVQPSALASGSTDVDYARHRISKLREALNKLDDTLRCPAKVADDARFALFSGRAGSGKSHLLAAEVQKTLDDSEPAIMLLGTDFSGAEPPAALIARRLDLSASTTQEELLGMLDASAERAETRALIVIDALNEGGGARYWRDRLLPFVKAVFARPRLALALSCRTEYQDYLITEGIRERSVHVFVQGFVTAEEQEKAARVYMDRRGIVRPATPWLSPEFTNPLFLRTACIALQEEGRTEFPRGLRGAKDLLGFYLDTAARHLGTMSDGSDELVRPLRRGVLALAEHMAANRFDHVPRSVAARLLADAFDGHAEPGPFGWLDLLRQRGVVRLDPGAPVDDDWAGAEDVIRFGFQRFQDHLVAQGLIKNTGGPAGLFQPNSPLAFLLSPYGVDYEWRGVFQALAIQFADVWQTEIVDHLPGGSDHWWSCYGIQDAFVESARWRLTTSFTHRSGELLSALDDPDAADTLLLELAVVQGHPWNADSLHAHLSSLDLAHRDSHWTTFVNAADADAGSPANRIIDWALGPGVAAAEDETLRLTLLALGWMLGSTSGHVRDHATKAMTEILLARSALHIDQINAFEDVNDPYVLERVLAASAGACLRDPARDRLRLAAAATWNAVFARAEPPRHTLLRDYARLIIELAWEKGVLGTECDLVRCRPPYGSPPPDLDLAEDVVRTECDAVGASSIFTSCAGFPADFGRYVIKNRTEDFSLVPLSDPRPFSREEAFENFKRDVIEGDELLELQLGIQERLHKLSQKQNHAAIRRKQTDPVLAAIIASLPKLQRDLLDALSPPARQRYIVDALPHLEGKRGWAGQEDGNLPRIDARAAQLWVAQRAVEMGWTKELFPHDSSYGADRLRRSRVERIGKKYQWIAYYELLARLADNFWLAPMWAEQPAVIYNTPLDLPFTRNIDPTIPPPTNLPNLAAATKLPKVPQLAIMEIESAEMADWVFDSAIPGKRLALWSSSDLIGDHGDWITLNRDASARLDWEGAQHRSIDIRFRQEEFHFIMMVAVKRSDRAGFVAAAKAANLDFHDWFRQEQTDGPFLYEAGMRQTWPEEQWDSSSGFRGPELEFTRFTHSYRWESHLDGSLPDGFAMEVPAPWLLRALALRADPRRLGIYVNADGEPVAVSGRGERNNYCLVRREPISELLDAQGLVPVWAGFGERSGWPKPGVNEGPRRRWNGLIWTIVNGTRQKVWHDDHKG